MYNMVKQLPTELYGLKYRPSLEPEYSNNVDTIPQYMKLIQKSHKGMTDKEIQIIKAELKLVKPHCILEIGVAWQKKDEKQIEEWNLNKSKLEHTSTELFLNSNSYYFGIDKNDRSYFHNPQKKHYFLQTDSRNIELVMNYLRKLRIYEIDFLMIDGYHSVNMTINDWQYSKYLSKNGVIILHDTNVHPGGYTVFDAIDDSLFEKKKYFEHDIDTFGLAVIKRKKCTIKQDWWKNV